MIQETKMFECRVCHSTNIVKNGTNRCCGSQAGNMLDILVQSRRNKKAAKRFFRTLLKRLQYVPRVIITDTLKSYGAVKREILPGVEHRQHKGLNSTLSI